MVVSRVSTKYELISDELIFHITPSENIFHVCFYCTKEKWSFRSALAILVERGREGGNTPP